MSGSSRVAPPNTSLIQPGVLRTAAGVVVDLVSGETQRLGRLSFSLYDAQFLLRRVGVRHSPGTRLRLKLSMDTTLQCHWRRVGTGTRVGLVRVRNQSAADLLELLILKRDLSRS